MEFVIISKTNTCTTFIHVSTEYLNILRVSSQEEYRQSIYATFFYDEASAQSKLQTTNFTKILGKSVFRHPRTNQIACIKFLTHIIKIDEETTVNYTCVFDIEWQETSHVVDTLHKCRTSELHKTVCRFGVEYSACPISIVFDGLSSETRKIVKERLTSFKCLFGINIVYKIGEGNTTHRSLLIPVAMFHGNMHSPSLQTHSLSKSVSLNLW